MDPELYYFRESWDDHTIRRYAATKSFVVDGVPYACPGPSRILIRPIVDLFDDHDCTTDCEKDDFAVYSYTMVPHDQGEICEQCWLQYRYIHGVRADCTVDDEVW